MEAFVLAAITQVATAGPVEDATAIALQGHNALLQGDPKTAVRMAGAALELDPDNVAGLAVRGLGLLAVRELPENQTDTASAFRAIAEAMAKADLARVAELAPDSSWAGLASLYLAPERVWLPQAPCSDAARSTFSDGEELFAARRMSEARDRYRAASELCPENSIYITNIGETYWGEGDAKTALRQYRRALDLDPCDVLAHFYAGDVLATLGRLDEARTHVVKGVACNPTYEPTWSLLAHLQRSSGAAMVDRKAEPRPLTSIRASDDAAPGRKAWAAWSQEYFAPSADPTTPPLERARVAVRAGLSHYGAPSPEDRSVWATLARADAAGQLDAAIYLLLWDDALLPGFETWRIENHEIAQRFVTTHLAPSP